MFKLLIGGKWKWKMGGVEAQMNFKPIEEKVLSKSTASLIVANLITLLIAVLNDLKISDLMWVYWVQSVIIGVFQFRKILDLKNFSTENFTINGRSVEAAEETKRYAAYFFLLHYNVFHLAYLIFLVVTSDVQDFLFLFVSGLGFFINHYFSYIENKKADSSRILNIGEMMFIPYLRIIPMHIMIDLGKSLNSGSLLIFVPLKTLSDVAMHVVEHSAFGRRQVGEDATSFKVSRGNPTL